MIKKLIDNIKNIDKNILKIMLWGFRFSFIVCIISCIISIFYILNPISHIIYTSGLILFKTGITFAVSFFIFAFVTDKIKKQMI